MLIVTEEDGRFKCVKKGDCGMCIVGDGLSVLEAVGSWCIYSGKVKVLCQPPELLEKFSVHKTTGYDPIPRRR